MYCTPDDLRARLEAATLLALADDNGDGEADIGVIEAALAEAAAQINSDLASRYAVPFASAPDAIRECCAQLAIAALFRRRRETPSPLHEEQAGRALERLRALAEGRASLPGIAPRALPVSNRTAADKINKSECLRNW